MFKHLNSGGGILKDFIIFFLFFFFERFPKYHPLDKYATLPEIGLAGKQLK